MSLTTSTPPALRREALREGLIGTVSLLKRCRAAEITEGFIDDYVALNWLEWQGGSLKLTITGENICKQVSSRLA
jgi:hypothetical protein